MKIICVAAPLLLAGACLAPAIEAGGGFILTGTMQGSPRTAAAVAVYRSSAPTQPHHEIGIITATGRSYAEVLQIARQLAAKNGCDAISNFSESTSSDVEQVWGTGTTTSIVFHLQASCLVYDLTSQPR